MPEVWREEEGTREAGDCTSGWETPRQSACMEAAAEGWAGGGVPFLGAAVVVRPAVLAAAPSGAGFMPTGPSTQSELAALSAGVMSAVPGVVCGVASSGTDNPKSPSLTWTGGWPAQHTPFAGLQGVTNTLACSSVLHCRAACQKRLCLHVCVGQQRGCCGRHCVT